LALLLPKLCIADTARMRKGMGMGKKKGSVGRRKRRLDSICEGPAHNPCTLPWEEEGGDAFSNMGS
jgi:hypothetical protein